MPQKVSRRLVWLLRSIWLKPSRKFLCKAWGFTFGGLVFLTVVRGSAQMQIVAWGDNFFGQTNVPAGLSDVRAIAAGYNHSLALRSNGLVVAWGDNSGGQTNVPTTLSNVMAIAGGAYHSLALRSNGTVLNPAALRRA